MYGSQQAGKGIWRGRERRASKEKEGRRKGDDAVGGREEECKGRQGKETDESRYGEGGEMKKGREG